MSKKSEQRTWANSLNFVLASAGSAIGLGNIWKFPYVAGENGGGAFVLVYLISIAFIGVPMLLGEILVGQKTQSNVVKAYARNGTPRWQGIGILAALSAFLMLTYYFVVGGWLLHFSGLFIEATWRGFLPDHAFSKLTGSATIQLTWHTVFTAAVFLSSRSGFKKGIETTNKIIMPILFLMLLAMLLQAFTLPGLSTAIDFLLNPRFSELSSAGILEAIGHSFFTLSLAIGVMVTYGSYLPETASIGSSVVRIAFLDTLVAISAGIVIFSLIFTFGGDPASGPGLLFESLPTLFAQLPSGGYFWGFLFFLLISFAAFSSAISATEVNVKLLNECLGWSRKTSSFRVVSSIYFFGCVIIVSPNLEKLLSVQLDLFSRTDYLVSNLLLPLTGLLSSIYFGYFFDPISRVSYRNSKAIWFCKMNLRYLCPAAIFAVFVQLVA